MKTRLADEGIMVWKVALLAAMVLLAGVAAPLSAQNASVRIVHGIPGADVSPGLDPALPVDVLVNDAICLLQGLTFGSIAGPYTLPEGTYDVKISVANTLEPCSGAAAIAAPVPVAAGENVSIGDKLISAGDGTLIANGSETSGTTVRQIVAIATEAEDLSGSGAVDTLIEVRVL